MAGKIAYFNCPTGIAGDMCLGALVDSGVPFDHLVTTLASLGITEEYELRQEKVLRGAQAATKIHVVLKGDRSHAQHHHHDHHHDHDHDHHHSHPRNLPQISRLINHAPLPAQVKIWSLEIFQRLAQAEADVHGTTPDQVHFHEVGATDAIVDIVGSCVGLDYLGVTEIYFSALPLGGGTVTAAHGVMTVPVPAVLKLCSQRAVPLYDNGIKKELVTPTGAAIAVTLAKAFTPPPQLQLDTVGWGAGSHNLTHQGQPVANALQLWLGTAPQKTTPAPSPDHSLDTQFPKETVAVLETQIDDLSPQAIAYCCQKLLAHGALDVFTQGITMKKFRQGTLLTVICAPPHLDSLETIIFGETSTLGIRKTLQQRSVLHRHFTTMATPQGPVPVKIAQHQSKIYNVKPEYDHCAAIAQKTGQPWHQVETQIREQWQRHHQPTEPHPPSQETP